MLLLMCTREIINASIVLKVRKDVFDTWVCVRERGHLNLLTAITSRVATLISASSKVHVTIEYHVVCLVFCMYSTLYSVQYGEILLVKS